MQDVSGGIAVLIKAVLVLTKLIHACIAGWVIAESGKIFALVGEGGDFGHTPVFRE